MGRYDDDIEKWEDERAKQFEQRLRDSQRDSDEQTRKMNKTIEEWRKEAEERERRNANHTYYNYGDYNVLASSGFWLFISAIVISLYIYQIPLIAQIMSIIGRIILLLPIVNNLFEHPNSLSYFQLLKYDIVSYPFAFIFIYIALKLLVKKLWSHNKK